MDGNVAFGAGKTGTGFDLVTYVTKPQVILRTVCWFCSLIVWACITMNGWHKTGRKEVCLFNKDSAACRFSSTIGFIGFFASIAFLVLEAFFNNLSSIKLRRRAVLLDVGFSAAWSALFLIVFAYLSIAWGKSDYPPLGKGINNCRAAIVFSVFAIAAWGGCAYLAYLRWQAGADMTQFTSGFQPDNFGPIDGNQGGMVDDQGYGMTGGGGGADMSNYQVNPDGQYSGYTAALESDPSYHSNPFTSAVGQAGNIDQNQYQQPPY